MMRPMSEVAEVVTVSVSEPVDGEVRPAVRKTRSDKGKHRRPRGLSTVRADPRVLREAMRLAVGDISRLRVNRDGSVSVLNRPGPYLRRGR